MLFPLADSLPTVANRRLIPLPVRGVQWEVVLIAHGPAMVPSILKIVPADTHQITKSAALINILNKSTGTSTSTLGDQTDNVGPEQLEAAEPKRQPVRAAAS